MTRNAAKVLGLGAVLGSLEAGKKADITVIAGNACAPYDAVLAATPADVRLVMVGGTTLYGDPTLQALAPAARGCEALSLCAHDKFAWVAAASTTASLGETFVQIQSAITTALTEYDAQHLSAYTFSHIAPLVKCQ